MELAYIRSSAEVCSDSKKQCLTPRSCAGAATDETWYLSAVCSAGAGALPAHHSGQEYASALVAEGLLPQRTNPNPLATLPALAAPRPKGRAVHSGGSDLTRHLLSAPSRGQLPF